jgi:serine/threonine protein kinase
LAASLEHSNTSTEDKLRAFNEFDRKESDQLRSRRNRMKVLDFQHLATIGKGGFGNVFLVRHKGTGGVFALKRMQKTAMKQRNQVHDI